MALAAKDSAIAESIVPARLNRRLSGGLAKTEGMSVDVPDPFFQQRVDGLRSPWRDIKCRRRLTLQLQRIRGADLKWRSYP